MNLYHATRVQNIVSFVIGLVFFTNMCLVPPAQVTLGQTPPGPALTGQAPPPPGDSSADDGFTPEQALATATSVFLPMITKPATVVPTPPAPTPSVPAPTPTTPPPPVGELSDYDWPQIGQNAQRSNATQEQVDPPYCYAWKWYETSLASRAQPIVSEGRLFIGGMDGRLYARDATNGAPLWSFASGGPIRHSAGELNGIVVFSSHDGYTYGLDAANGSLLWQTATGASATAPLMDASRNWVYVAATTGKLSALRLSDGDQQWQYDAGAPILTSPALSADNQTVFLGNEAIYAIAVNAGNGAERWRTRLQGQSLADRYPVVAGNSVIYRSQPLYFFHLLLQEGDEVLNRAGSLLSDWNADWAKVRPEIVDYLTQEPSKQTFFVLDAASGASRGVVPILYTYGNNDIPNAPVVKGDAVYVTYRPRHGIQNDSGAVHVTTQYDAELGILNLNTLDIRPVTAADNLGYPLEFRMTSDEPAMLTMGGNLLLVDNWERLGGVNVAQNDLVHVGGVSNDWPECFAQCGPGTDNPFFPLRAGEAAYPFPSPRVTEGHQRGGAVIANSMIYWRVIAGGLAAVSHQSGGSCPQPQVWDSPTAAAAELDNEAAPAVDPAATTRDLSDYITLDLTQPPANPDPALVNRVRAEVRAMIAPNQHLMPFFLERGFSKPVVWPYNTSTTCSSSPCLPMIAYPVGVPAGNVFWHDPGELLYTMAMVYPYLDAELQGQVKSYVNNQMAALPPLQNLPWSGNPNPLPDWLVKGAARESYEVPYRSELNIWPPPAANISALYGLWLWSKNTGDWSYAQAHWSQAKSLFSARKGSLNYYADIGGAIGYARLAEHFADSAALAEGRQAALAGLQAGLNFETFRQRAESDYLDPRDMPTGWYAPVFYGLTPEVGLYLREQFNGTPQAYLASKEQGDGLRWWYLTRVGAHAQNGETSYETPMAGWSHFLAQAYVVGKTQPQLKAWLDRPWAVGDLYSLQKIVAALQAAP